MAAASLSSLFSVKAASWDTQQSLPYNRQRTSPKKTPNPNTVSSTTTTTLQSLSNYIHKPTDSSISALLSRNIQSPIQGKLEETYLGYETLLLNLPKAEKPLSMYNVVSLAYIRDSIYELCARSHFLFPSLNIEEYNDRVMAVARCETQGYYSVGKNIGSAKTRTKKRVGAAVYNRASSLETLVSSHVPGGF